MKKNQPDKEKSKEKIWNVPNALTMLRMALIPVYWALFFTGHRHEALAVFAVASLTDILDGYIARKYHLITNFGKLMDPLADKIMSLSVLLSLVIAGIAPWPVLLILLLKEGFMVVGGLLLFRKDIVVYSHWIGKVAQLFVVLGLLACFFWEWLTEKLGFPLHLALMWTGVGLTVCALIHYVRWGLKLYRDKKREQA
ncbi:MAG: CDP-alcohol phosphatidyltransferase family protein [Clostridia bacterium]|nr:CDP-alcohol phosphatidyltransferase family protein [Clostridia bacterium]